MNDPAMPNYVYIERNKKLGDEECEVLPFQAIEDAVDKLRDQPMIRATNRETGEIVEGPLVNVAQGWLWRAMDYGSTIEIAPLAAGSDRKDQG